MRKPNHSFTAVMLLAIFVVMAITLRAMGRGQWCGCESWIPWSWDIWSSHNSQHLIDSYFFTHVLHGVILFWVLHWLPQPAWLAKQLRATRLPVRLLAAVVLEATWEIFENSSMIIERYREATISLDYYGDSIANSVFDVLACLLGYVLASKLRWYGSLAIFAVIEMSLLLSIRDSLVLNIIMLACPIDAIKQWQTP